MPRKSSAKRAESSSTQFVVVVSDTHCGCRVGLCPPEVELDDGFYRASRIQNKVWDWWCRFWDEFVPQATEGQPFTLVVNGDALEGNHHRGVSQITHNMHDQELIAEAVLAPRVKLAAQYFHIRGTEAHVGKSGQHEESVAKALKAAPDADKKYARWELFLWVNDKLIHFLHHVGTTGAQHYESTALWGEYMDSCLEAGRWGLDIPDMVVRSHRHRNLDVHGPTHKGRGYVFTTAGWQLKTPYVYRLRGARSSQPQLGGHVICVRDDKLWVEHFISSMERPEYEGGRNKPRRMARSAR